MKCESKYSPMLEDNNCIAKPNLLLYQNVYHVLTEL